MRDTTCLSHVYGTRSRCLVCGHPAPPRPRPFMPRWYEHVEQALRARPTVPDIAGWGEQGDPWQ